MFCFSSDYSRFVSSGSFGDLVVGDLTEHFLIDIRQNLTNRIQTGLFHPVGKGFKKLSRFADTLPITKTKRVNRQVKREIETND